MTTTTRSPGRNPRWARSPWTTSCSAPRSRRWRANALWPTGGRDDEQGTLALLCLLLWSGARCTRVEDLARQRLSLSQRDAAEHERPSPWSGRRMFGRGTGRSYPAIEHRDIPAHWPRIGGMNFGWDHPFAAVELAWDREGDVVYVLKTHRLKEATPVVHAGA